MSNIIRVNTTTLKKDTDSIVTELNKVRKRIAAMKTDVKELNKMWEGEANKAFNQAFEDDITELEQICEMFDELVKYEQTAKKEYDTCEREVGALVDSISI